MENGGGSCLDQRGSCEWMSPERLRVLSQLLTEITLKCCSRLTGKPADSWTNLGESALPGGPCHLAWWQEDSPAGRGTQMSEHIRWWKLYAWWWPRIPLESTRAPIKQSDYLCIVVMCVETCSLSLHTHTLQQSVYTYVCVLQAVTEWEQLRGAGQPAGLSRFVSEAVWSAAGLDPIGRPASSVLTCPQQSSKDLKPMLRFYFILCEELFFILK